MELKIKNMVCQRCIAAVEQTLLALNLDYKNVSLGSVTLNHLPSEALQNALNEQLTKQGFEIISNKESKQIQAIKDLIIQTIHHSLSYQPNKWSETISKALNSDYKHLSQLFSSTEGITIEQYIIRQKVEKAKELISYDELSLSQIAYQLDYSSVAHLSGQFKKVTGMTPSQFKKNGVRKPLDEI